MYRQQSNCNLKDKKLQIPLKIVISPEILHNKWFAKEVSYSKKKAKFRQELN